MHGSLRRRRLDHGAIIVQKAIPVLDEDDEQSCRILEQEHIAYSEAINIVLEATTKWWAADW